MGSAPFLKQVLDAPLEIISMAGVFCGHNDILRLEHIYHLVGDKDPVERLGPIFFPKRWKLMALSYWNRAKRRGAVTFISLGPVGHQTPGGVLDPNQKLPDGRTHLQQTLDWVTEILQGTLPTEHQPPVRQPSSYALFQQGQFNHPDYYPVLQTLDTEHYRPIAPWMGRLILPTPDQRQSLNGVWFEVYHAEAPYADLVGQVVPLGWQDSPRVKAYGEAVTRDLHFSADADYSLRQGKIVPERLNGWRLVNPLESLAGARPTDNMVVMLNGLVVVQAPAAPDQGTPRVLIAQDPAEITGRYYAIVQFMAPLGEDGDGVPYRVRHFNKTSRQFDGLEEVVLLPQVIPNENGLPPSSSRDLAQSPCNGGGWYIYGAKTQGGQFVVQALAPRQLFSLQPDRELVGKKPATEYLKKGSWALAGVKGTISSVLLRPRASTPDFRTDLQAGDRLLLNHLYGGIGGKMREPAAQGPVYFGHFAYGLAEVVLEPLTDELRMEIQYFQVYAHNGDGLIACRHHWSNYMGDRQYGWLGLRPVRDIVIKLDAFTGTYDLDGELRSPLDGLIDQLQIMMARYRIGDGTGSTFVGPANNCAQDSNQALYAALQRGSRAREWTQVNPDAAPKIKQLIRLGRSLKRDLLPWGTARADWKGHETVLGSSLEDDPLKQLWMGLVSWRTVLPRVASDAVVQSFLQQGATVLVLRTSQVGGSNPDIDSIAPLSL
jgi:predicted Abi (CAAX) family protease